MTFMVVTNLIGWMLFLALGVALWREIHLTIVGETDRTRKEILEWRDIREKLNEKDETIQLLNDRLLQFKLSEATGDYRPMLRSILQVRPKISTDDLKEDDNGFTKMPDAESAVAVDDMDSP